MMRNLVAATCALLGLAALPATASAQSFPSQPVKIVVTFPAGGAADILSRAIAQKLSETFKSGVVVENRPGGAGNIGMTFVARAAPDGYTLGVGTLSSLAINPAASKTMQYDARKDFAPVSMMTEVHIVLAIPAAFPANNLAEFVDYAKKNPTKMNYSSNGPGSSGHMVGELLKRKFGFEMAHVPQAGDSPILNSLMGEHIQLGILAAPATAEFVKAGKVKVISATSAKRSPVLPEAPTLMELGADISASTWFGLVAPAATPKDIVALLNREINRAMQSPETKKIFNTGGLEPIIVSVDEFQTFMRDEQVKWAGIVKTLGISME